MDHNFTFRLAPATPSLTSQLSRTLELRTELRSRDAYPRLWKITDQLNSRTKAQASLSSGKQKFFLILAVVDLLLGLFLLCPFAVAPEKLVIPGAAGLLATVIGVQYLWRNNRSLLAGMALVLGAFLTLGAVISVDELGRLLPIGAPLLAVGLAALDVRKHSSTSKFDKAAKQLIDARNSLPKDAPATITFTDEGISALEARPSPYTKLDGVFEAKDLFLVELEGKFLLLQKCELTQGTPEEFSAFIRQQLN